MRNDTIYRSSHTYSQSSDEEITKQVSVVRRFVRVNVSREAECKGKGKAIPLQAWSGPEGSKRMKLTDFKTIGT